jgi:ATP-dependent RNA helicase MSS116, mitochondrial
MRWNSTLRICAQTSRALLTSSARTQRRSLPAFQRRVESGLATNHPDTQEEPLPPTSSPASKSDDPPALNESSLPTFDSLRGSISYPTLKALTVRPFKLTHMSPVQAQVLPFLPEIADPYDSESPPKDENGRPRPRDLLVRAKTGTGKTLAFLIPAVEARVKAIVAHGKQAVIDAGVASDKHLQHRAMRAYVREHVGALVISPTRELATQIANEALRLTQHHDDMEVRLLVGGNSRGMQLREWNRGRVDIVVATPGRLMDLLSSEPGVADAIRKTKMVSALSYFSSLL